MADLTTSITIQLKDAFSAHIRQMNAALKDTKKGLDNVKKGFELAANMRQAAQGAGEFGRVVLGALKPAADEFIAFEKAMSGVAAMTNEIGTPAFRQMREQAIQLGASTQYSGTQVAEAMQMFGQQGLNAQQIMQATPKALALASAGMLEIAEAADIAGVAMAGMRIPADQLGHVTDALAYAANAANTDVRGIGEAFKYVAPIAADAKTSLDLTVAMIGKLSDAGIKGSSAGTGLRMVFQRLESPGKAAIKSMQKYGLQLGEIKKLQENVAKGRIDLAIQKFAEVGKKLPDAKRLELLSDIFAAEGGAAASVLINASLDTGDKGLGALNAALQKVDGYASRTAGILNDNLAGDIERTGGAFSELALRMGEMLRPAIRSLAFATQDLFASTVAWAQANPDLANSLVRTTAMIGGGSLALKGFLLAGSTISSTLELGTKGVKLFMAGVTGLANVIADMPAALRAVQGGFYLVQSAVAAQGGLTAALKAMSLSMLGPAAAVVAVGALAYALGTWADQAFGISDKLATALGWFFDGKDLSHEKTDKVGLGDVEMYGDGTKVDKKTGMVLALGTGSPTLAPKKVQEARAAGAITVDQVNAAIEEKRAKAAANAAAPAAAPPASKAGVQPVQQPRGSDAAARATREQTDVLDRGLRRIEQATREQVEETRRARRMRGTGTPGTLGGF